MIELLVICPTQDRASAPAPHKKTEQQTQEPQVIPHSRSYSQGQRMRSDDASQMAAPRDRHSPSPARAGGHAVAPPLASSHRLAREQPPPRRTVRGRAPLENVICRDTNFCKHSLAIRPVALSRRAGTRSRCGCQRYLGLDVVVHSALASECAAYRRKAGYGTCMHDASVEVRAFWCRVLHQDSTWLNCEAECNRHDATPYGMVAHERRYEPTGLTRA